MLRFCCYLDFVGPLQLFTCAHMRLNYLHQCYGLQLVACTRKTGKFEATAATLVHFLRISSYHQFCNSSIFEVFVKLKTFKRIRKVT